jgi:hypothetical protein
MTRILAAFTVLLVLTGCATVPKLSTSDADRVKGGKSTVLFMDDVEQINYLQDKYYVLAVTQEGSTSVYKGLWNSSKDLSAVHADEFSKLGLQAKSAFELLGEQDIARLTQEDKIRYTVQPRQTGGGPAAPAAKTITPQLRQALLDKGQDYLIWGSWSGYTLHIQTLGLPPNEQFLLRYWIFDLKQNQFLGGGDVLWLQKVDLGGQTGKDFLEKNNLAGLRSQVEKQIRARFADPPKATVGAILGLKAAS